MGSIRGISAGEERWIVLRRKYRAKNFARQTVSALLELVLLLVLLQVLSCVASHKVYTYRPTD